MILIHHRQRGWYALLTLVLFVATQCAAAASAAPRVTVATARAALLAQDYGAAANAYTALSTSEPTNADYLLGLGQAQLGLSQTTAAIATLERAHALAPAYLDVLQVLASAYRRAARPADARKIYNDALTLSPAVAWARDGLTATAPADARGPPAPADGRWIFTSGFESTLTERDDTWHEQSIGLAYGWAPRAHLGLRAAHSERFNADDSLLAVEASLPLGTRVTLAASGVVSPSHHVRVQHGGLLEASLALPHGLGLSLGGGRMIYDNGPSDLLSTTLESYVGAFRLAYTATLVKPPRAGWTPAHRWAGNWYYGAENMLGVQIARGEETDATLIGATALIFDTWGAGINGRHWLNRHFALDYAAGYNGLESPRGDHLDRTTVYFGVALRP